MIAHSPQITETGTLCSCGTQVTDWQLHIEIVREFARYAAEKCGHPGCFDGDGHWDGCQQPDLMRIGD